MSSTMIPSSSISPPDGIVHLVYLISQDYARVSVCDQVLGRLFPLPSSDLSVVHPHIGMENAYRHTTHTQVDERLSSKPSRNASFPPRALLLSAITIISPTSTCAALKDIFLYSPRPTRSSRLSTKLAPSSYINGDVSRTYFFVVWFQRPYLRLIPPATNSSVTTVQLPIVTLWIC